MEPAFTFILSCPISFCESLKIHMCKNSVRHPTKKSGWNHLTFFKMGKKKKRRKRKRKWGLEKLNQTFHFYYSLSHTKKYAIRFWRSGKVEKGISSWMKKAGKSHFSLIGVWLLILDFHEIVFLYIKYSWNSLGLFKDPIQKKRKEGPMGDNTGPTNCTPTVKSFIVWE